MRVVSVFSAKSLPESEWVYFPKCWTRGPLFHLPYYLQSSSEDAECEMQLNAPEKVWSGPWQPPVLRTGGIKVGKHGKEGPNEKILVHHCIMGNPALLQLDPCKGLKFVIWWHLLHRYWQFFFQICLSPESPDFNYWSAPTLNRTTGQSKFSSVSAHVDLLTCGSPQVMRSFSTSGYNKTREQLEGCHRVQSSTYVTTLCTADIRNNQIKSN